MHFYIDIKVHGQADNFIAEIQHQSNTQLLMYTNKVVD